MKRIAYFILLLLLAVSAFAQEQGTREVIISPANDVRTGSPIDVTKEHSEVSFRYVLHVIGNRLRFFQNDRLTRLMFKGYNPGKEIKRHLTVSISEDSRKNPIVIFDGDYTIPHGGTADNCIPLLAIDFSFPLIEETSKGIYLKITCTGEPAETPIYFEQEVRKNYLGEEVCLPTCTLTVQYDAGYYNCTITDSNGNPVAGAKVSVFGEQGSYEGVTDENGKCCIKLDHPRTGYRLMVEASGYSTFISDLFFLGNFQLTDVIDFVPTNIKLFDQLTFTAGKQATIILPEDPDPSWGRYYSFKERKYSARDSFYFEREYHPKANTPYVIFPAKDFSLKFSDYDLPVPEGNLLLKGVVVFGEHPESDEYPSPGLWGAYLNQPPFGRFNYKWDPFLILDSTSDCGIYPPMRYRRVGACRAYLVGGSGIFPKFFFLDSQGGETGIDETVSTEPDTDPYYDLQGRRLTGLPKKGLYIRNRRKIVVR
jgi:hypothetical protein